VTKRFSLVELGMPNFDVDCDYTGGPGAECTVDSSGAPNSGDTTLRFRVSDELISRGRPNGRWVGGCVDPVAGSASPDCNPANPGGYNDGLDLRHAALPGVKNNFTDDHPSTDLAWIREMCWATMSPSEVTCSTQAPSP
jgi:hypothetical protein